MKRLEEKDQYTFESFESTIEFIQVVSARPDSSGPHLTAREKDGNKWSDGNLESNRFRLINGDPKLFKRMKGLKVERPKTLIQKRPQYFNAPEGFAPNVPNAIRGLPDSMICTKMEPRKAKIIDVLVESGTSMNVKPSEIAAFGNKVLNYIEQLERQGFRIRLSIFITFNSGFDSRFYACKIQLKNERQPLAIKKLAYPLNSSGMLRMLFFDWLDTCPNAEHIPNYGIPLSIQNKSFQKYVLDIVRENPNQVYLYFGCNIAKEFNLEKDSI